MESRRVPLGRSGMTISPAGLGAWAISGTGWGHGWGSQDDADSIATIRHAVASGVNWIDTAPAYGLGHSEEVVGAALTGIAEADRPYIFTKCGLVPDGPDRMTRLRRSMATNVVERDLDSSLRRLGVERIDLYQVHHPGDESLLGEPSDMSPAELENRVGEYWTLMDSFVKAGKVRAIGMSNHSVGQLDRAARVAPVAALQERFSALDQASAPQIEWAARHDAGVLAYSPMESGLLTGTWTPERLAGLGDDDWRRRSPRFAERLTTAGPVLSVFRDIANRQGVSVAAVAVAWVLAWPGITAAIVGARRPGQVNDWLAAGDVTLAHSDLAAVNDALATATPSAMIP